MTIIVPLTRGYEAIIDDEDAERVLSRRWYAQVNVTPTATRVYAHSHLSGVTVSLHQFLMDPPKGMVVDHINHDTLNYRRCNLRVATHSQNLANTQRGRSKWGYRGVKFQDGLFYSSICCNGRRHYSRGFKTPEEAAKKRDEMAIQYFGEFAALNFPNQGEILQSLEERSARTAAQISGSSSQPSDLLPASLPMLSGINEIGQVR